MGGEKDSVALLRSDLLDAYETCRPPRPQLGDHLTNLLLQVPCHGMSVSRRLHWTRPIRCVATYGLLALVAMLCNESIYCGKE